MFEKFYENIPAILAFFGVILTIVGNAYLQSRKDKTELYNADDKASAEFRDDLMARMKQQDDRLEAQDKRIAELQSIASTLWNENAEVKREKLKLELAVFSLTKENEQLKAELEKLKSQVKDITQH